MPRNGRLPQKRLNFFVIDSRIIVTLGDSSNRLSPRNVSSILFSNSLFPTKPNSYKRKNHFYRYPVTIRFATSIRLIAHKCKQKKKKKERKISNTKEFALIWIQNQVWSKRERERKFERVIACNLQTWSVPSVDALEEDCLHSKKFE